MEKRRFLFLSLGLLFFTGSLFPPLDIQWSWRGFYEPQFEHHHVRHRSGGTVGQPAGMRVLHSPAGSGQHRPGLLLFRGRLRLYPLQRGHDHEHSAPDQRPVHFPGQLLTQTTARPRAGPTYDRFFQKGSKRDKPGANHTLFCSVNIGNCPFSLLCCFAPMHMVK